MAVLPMPLAIAFAPHSVDPSAEPILHSGVASAAAGTEQSAIVAAEAVERKRYICDVPPPA
jgi:hypothetical protein